MKKLSVFLIVLLFGGQAFATSFTLSRSLSFGTLIPVTSSGSVSIGLDSSITTNGNVTVAPSGSTYRSGLAVYTGTGLSVVADVLTMTVLSSSVTLSNGVGGTVTVDNFITTPNLQISLLNSSANVYLGGTMHFTAASTPGNYTGSVQIRGSGLLSGSATVTVPIILTLWKPLGISQTSALNFGGIEKITGNSRIRIAPQTGARTITSGASGVNLIASKPGVAGAFQVTGNPSTAVSISLPSSTTLTGPGTAMTVNNFVGYPGSTSATLDTNGNLNLQIGADLTVNTNQTRGTYNGTYNVTISY